MTANKQPPRRKSTRLAGYNYTQPGAYFVTICTHKREATFGAVQDGVMALNEWGFIAKQCWQAIPEHLTSVRLDESVIMPNHVHGIVWLDGNREAVGMGAVGDRHACPLPPPSLPLGGIIGSFKSAVTHRINLQRNTLGMAVWQRNYYDHVIRTDDALFAIRRYMLENPQRWLLDQYHPEPTGPDPCAAEIWRMLQEQR